MNDTQGNYHLYIDAPGNVQWCPRGCQINDALGECVYKISQGIVFIMISKGNILYNDTLGNVFSNDAQAKCPNMMIPENFLFQNDALGECLCKDP